MKNKLRFHFVLMLLAWHPLFSQTFITQVKPAGSKTWGYANVKGEVIIPAEYAKCFKFSEEGLALIYDTKEKEFYFIDVNRERLKTEIKGFRMKEEFGLNFNTEGFINGMCLIKYQNKWGYLDNKGKLAINAKYDAASYFNNGYATAKRGSIFVIINKSGKEIVTPPSVIDLNEFSENLAPYKTADKKFGFIGIDGDIVIKAQFEAVGFFENGLAWAKSDGLLGYINKKGDWVIKPHYQAGKSFDKISGLARVKIGEKWIYINQKGEEKNIYDAAMLSSFSEGLADGKKNEKVGFYDATGKWVIEPQYDAVRDFKNGYAAAKKEEKWGMINTQGKWVIQPTFDAIKDMELVK